jgi:hypothetical protein
LVFDDHGLSSDAGIDRGMTSFVGTRVKAKALRRQRRSCAAASKHRGQTQSALDPAGGMGRRKGSAAHQHSPPSPQSKARPQRAQIILRDATASPASIERSSRAGAPCAPRRFAARELI